MPNLSKRLLPLLLCLACVAALFPAQARAAGTGENAQLTVRCQQDGAPLSGVHFDLYYVATVDDNAVFKLTDAFAKYYDHINFRNLTSAEWKNLAEMLRTYAQRDGIAPVTSGTTGADGTMTCSGLAPGLYLAAGKNFTQGDYDYVMEPFLAALSDGDAAVTATAKFTRQRHTTPSTPSEPSKSTVERKVLKSWKGEGEHPDAVTIQLLKNGAVYDTVTLNDANNWRHTWSELDKYENGTLIDWQVTETAVSGYKVSVSQEGVTFLVTNTKDEPSNPDDPNPPNEPDEPIIDIPDDDIPTTDLPDTPTDPDQPSTDIPDDDTPRAPATPDKPNKTTTTKKDKLPQTGALWWPVPVLAAGGLLCLILGVVTKKGNEDE